MKRRTVDERLQLDSLTVVRRLVVAVNRHDLDDLVACFADDYVNEIPSHPARGFQGSALVRQNWNRILDAVPDLEADLLRATVDGNTVWTEWQHRGTHRDGSRHVMRGVVIFTVIGDQLTHARFYLEPVEHGGGGIDATIHATFDAHSRAPGEGAS